MLSCSFMFMLGIFFAGYLYNIPAFFVFGCLFFSVSFIVLKEKNIKKRAVFSILGLFLYIIGGFFSYSYQENLFYKANSFVKSKKSVITGTVTDDITVSKNYVSMIVKTKSDILINLKCYTDTEFLPGDIVNVYNPKLEVLNRNNRMISKYSRLMGKNTLVTATCYNNQAVKTGINKKYNIPRYFYKLRKQTFYSLVKYLDFQDAAFAYSVVSSDKSYMSMETYSDFISAGLIHLSSVSGFHFVFLCGVFTALAVLFSPYHRRRILFVISLSFVFMLYTGGGASVVRAFVMFLGTQIGDLFYSRRFKNSTCLAFVTVLMLIQNPLCIFNSSFLLSFGSTYGIVFLSNDISSFFKRHLTREIFLINTCVTIFTLPIVYSTFGRITVFSALSNFAVDSVVGIMMLFAFLLWGADLYFKPLCLVISPLLKIIIKYIFAVVKIVSKIEILKLTGAFSVICVVFLIGTVIFLIKYLRNIKNKKILATLCIFFVAFCSSLGLQYYDNNTYATVIDNSRNISVDVINKHRHIIVSGIDDFIYNKYNSSVKQNEVVDVFVITDGYYEDLQKIYEAFKDYKINNIVGFENVVDKIKKDGRIKSNFYSFKNFSNDKIKFEIKDGNIKWIKIFSNDKTLILTDNYNYLQNEKNSFNNETIMFFGTNKYLEEAKNIEFDKNVKIYCGDTDSLITLSEE